MAIAEVADYAHLSDADIEALASWKRSASISRIHVAQRTGPTSSLREP
jgi:hypothetical protein